MQKADAPNKENEEKGRWQARTCEIYESSASQMATALRFHRKKKHAQKKETSRLSWWAIWLSVVSSSMVAASQYCSR